MTNIRGVSGGLSNLNNESVQVQHSNELNSDRCALSGKAITPKKN